MTNVDDLMDETKELKVKIPTEHHVKLQSLKILAGKNISTAVTEAIAMYLQNHGEAPADLDVEVDVSDTGRGSAEA